MAPKQKSSGAGNSDMSKRSPKGHSLNESFPLKEKKSYTEVATFYDENKSICEILKMEKKF